MGHLLVCLNRKKEALAGLFGHRLQGRRLGDGIIGGVDFASVEFARVIEEPIPFGHAHRVERAYPVVIAEPGGAQINHGSSLAHPPREVKTLFPSPLKVGVE